VTGINPAPLVLTGHHRKGSLLVPGGMWCRVDFGTCCFLVYFPSVPVNRYAPFGTAISNRALLPGTPFSVIVMPVIARISRERAKPGPVFFPKIPARRLFPSFHLQGLFLGGNRYPGWHNR